MNNVMSILKKNRKIVVLVLAIIIVLIIFKVAIKEVEDNNKTKASNNEIKEIMKKKQTKIIYVGSRDSKKCSKCKEVVEYLKKEGIEFVTYEVEDHSKDEYNEMLKTLEINPDDFGYPGVIYVRNGRLYSNVINIHDIKSLETFIKDYELKTELKNLK